MRPPWPGRPPPDGKATLESNGLLDDVTGLQLLVGSLHTGGDNGELGDGPLPTPEMIAQAMQTPDVCAAVHGLLHRPNP